MIPEYMNLETMIQRPNEVTAYQRALALKEWEKIKEQLKQDSDD